MKRALILSGGGARGAYQAGVYKYLEEVQFTPDIICGTSIGAINATAIGTGMDSNDLIRIWRSIDKKKILRYSIWKTIIDIFKRRFSPLVDISPITEFLQKELDFSKLLSSQTDVVISAVNILTAELKYFSNKDIQLEHVLASSAIPIFFPWQLIDNEPYWDGGLMANTPIYPALEKGAKEIVVVLLSPIGGNNQLGLPTTRKEAIERVFEMSLISSYNAILADKEDSKAKGIAALLSFLQNKQGVKIHTVAPSNSLGLKSILNFNAHQSDILIEYGYNDAKSALSGKL